MSRGTEFLTSHNCYIFQAYCSHMRVVSCPILQQQQKHHHHRCRSASNLPVQYHRNTKLKVTHTPCAPGQAMRFQTMRAQCLSKQTTNERGNANTDTCAVRRQNFKHSGLGILLHGGFLGVSIGLSGAVPDAFQCIHSVKSVMKPWLSHRSEVFAQNMSFLPGTCCKIILLKAPKVSHCMH